MSTPQDLMYSKTHEWIRITGNEGVMGITDFAQKELGDIVYVELPKVGQKVKFEEACAVVESVKAASDIYAPVTGTVTRVNETLLKDSSWVNKAPYGEGWFFAIQIEGDLKSFDLLDSSGYEDLIKSEA